MGNPALVIEGTLRKQSAKSVNDYVKTLRRMAEKPMLRELLKLILP